MGALDDDALCQAPDPKQAHDDVALHGQPAAAGPHLIHHIHPLALHLWRAMLTVIRTINQYVHQSVKVAIAVLTMSQHSQLLSTCQRSEQSYTCITPGAHENRRCCRLQARYVASMSLQRCMH